MSDAFALGIQSAQASRRSRDAEAATLGQIYSNMFLQNAQMEESRTRAKMQLELAMRQIDAGLEKERISEAGANTRQQIQVDAAVKKSYLEKTLDIYKQEMDNRQELEKVYLQETLQGKNELAKQRLTNEGNLATTLLQTRASVTAATIQGKHAVFNNLIDNEYGPDAAKLIMDKYDSALGATYGIFSQVGPPPKSVRENQKFLDERQKNRVLYGEPVYDEKTGKPIPGTGGLEWQKFHASQSEGYTRSLGIFSENVKRNMELADGLQARMFKVAEAQGGDKSIEAGNLAALDELIQELSQNPSMEGGEVYKQKLAMILGNSKIPRHLWTSYIGIQTALSYNQMRASDVLGIGVTSIPTEKMIRDFHGSMPEDVRNPVEKMAGWLYNVVIPGGVRSIAEKGFNSLAQVGVGTQLNLDDEIINGLKKTGEFKGKATLTQLAGMNANEKVAFLQQLAATNPELQEQAKDAMLAYRGLGSIVGETLIGDLSTQNPIYKEGHYGLLGDAALVATFAKAGQIGWKVAAPLIRRIPIADKLVARIEQAVGANADNIAYGWGPQFAKEFGDVVSTKGARGVQFPKGVNPNTQDPSTVYSEIFFEDSRLLSQAGKDRLNFLRQKRAGKPEGPDFSRVVPERQYTGPFNPPTGVMRGDYASQAGLPNFIGNSTVRELYTGVNQLPQQLMQLQRIPTVMPPNQLALPGRALQMGNPSYLPEAIPLQQSSLPLPLQNFANEQTAKLARLFGGVPRVQGPPIPGLRMPGTPNPYSGPGNFVGPEDYIPSPNPWMPGGY